MSDLRVVLAKEWLELRKSDSMWVAVATLIVFLAMIGIFLPWLLGPLWLRAPWVTMIWAWIPMFLVTTVTADSFAGERERRTLETLLATRLSDGAILWGKWLAAVVWVAGAMLLSFPLGVLSLNLMFAQGPYLPSIGQVLATVAVAFAAGGLGGALGILVSLRAASVRHGCARQARGPQNGFSTAGSARRRAAPAKTRDAVKAMGRSLCKNTTAQARHRTLPHRSGAVVG